MSSWSTQKQRVAVLVAAGIVGVMGFAASVAFAGAGDSASNDHDHEAEVNDHDDEAEVLVPRMSPQDATPLEYCESLPPEIADQQLRVLARGTDEVVEMRAFEFCAEAAALTPPETDVRIRAGLGMTYTFRDGNVVAHYHEIEYPAEGGSRIGREMSADEAAQRLAAAGG